MKNTSDNNSPRPRANSMQSAAEALSISQRTLWRMIQAGEIKSIKLSARRRVITDAEIERILNPAAPQSP